MHLEPHHPDLFWYGIHGTEILYTIMGPGCQTVARTSPGTVEGVWKDGSHGIFVAKKVYGATVESARKTQDVGPYEGYVPLLIEIAKFFRSGKPPVSAEETLELYAFMEAADESQRCGGAPISIKNVMKKAEDQIAHSAE